MTINYVEICIYKTPSHIFRFIGVVDVGVWRIARGKTGQYTAL